MAGDIEVKKIVIPIEVDGTDAKVGFDKFKKMLDGGKKEVGFFRQITIGAFREIGVQITRALTAVPRIALRQFSRFMKTAIRDAVEFQTALAEVSTLGEFNMGNLRRGIEDVSMALGTDLVDSTRAVYQAISAGVPEENVLSFLADASKAAVAGLSNTETSVDALTSVLNAYNLASGEASRISDLFFQTIKLGKTRFEELAGSMGRVAPLAKATNVSLEEMFGSLAALTQVGLRTEEAVTGLRGVLTGLLKPMDEGKRLLYEMGFNAENMAESIGEHGLMGVLQAIGSGGIEALKKVIPEIRGLNAALALLGEDSGMKAVATIEAMNNAAGASNEAFEKMKNTVEGAWRRLKATRGTIKQTILQPFIDVGPEIMNAIADWFGGGGYSAADTKTIEQLTGVKVAASPGGAVLANIRAWAERTSEKLKSDFDAFMAGDLTFDDIVAGWINAASGAIDKIITAIKPFIDGLADAFVSALGKALQNGIGNLAQGAVNQVNKINPFAYAATWAGGLAGGAPSAPPLALQPGVSPFIGTPESAGVTVVVNGIDMPMSELSDRIVEQATRYRLFGPTESFAFGG